MIIGSRSESTKNYILFKCDREKTHGSLSPDEKQISGKGGRSWSLSDEDSLPSSSFLEVSLSTSETFLVLLLAGSWDVVGSRRDSSFEVISGDGLGNTCT